MTFSLNGQRVEVPEGFADDRLLWVLRDVFGLYGPRHGCGVGVCGACVVHVDGRAERACLLRPADVEGRAVVTLDGIATPSGQRHPVQRAFIEESVPQCGYCQNGQIMTAIALLANDRDADDSAIARAMDDVLCRCGTQTRIRAAIKRAQELMREDAVNAP